MPAACEPRRASARRRFRRGAGASPPNDILRLQLIVEELSNTVNHGLPGEGAVQVRLMLAVSPTQVENLSKWIKLPRVTCSRRMARAKAELDAQGDDRGPGGLGRLLVPEMASRVDCVRTDRCNRLSVVLVRVR